MSNEQEELFKPDFGFFHFFRTMIRNGTWAKMSLAAKAIYPVIKSYAASDNGAAFPSYETLMSQAGIARQSVSNALKELADLGLISAKVTAGKKTIYSIKETFAVQTPQGASGTASFDYVPQVVQNAVAELKALIATGAQGKIIQINLNFNTAGGTQNVTNHNIDGGVEIQKIMDLLEEKEAVDNS